MELLQLTYFCHAAETENFSATAKKFSVPPSDISQSIKRLEKELSTSLFVRGANRISLNEKGREFYKQVKSALSLIEAAVTEVTDDGAFGQIKICVEINRRLVMQTIEKYRRLYPQVDIIAKHSKYSAGEDFDFVISAEKIADKDFEGTEILSEEILLAMNRDSALARLELPTAKELQSEHFVTLTEGNNLYTITKQACEEMGFCPRIAIQSEDPFYVRRCVELGLCVAFVPAISWRGQFSDEIVLKRTTNLRRQTYVCRNKKKYMSRCAKEFLSMLIEECKNEEKACS